MRDGDWPKDWSEDWKRVWNDCYGDRSDSPGRDRSARDDDNDRTHDDGDDGDHADADDSDDDDRATQVKIVPRGSVDTGDGSAR